jgi:hypothetical protein
MAADELVNLGGGGGHIVGGPSSTLTDGGGWQCEHWPQHSDAASCLQHDLPPIEVLRSQYHQRAASLAGRHRARETDTLSARIEAQLTLALEILNDSRRNPGEADQHLLMGEGLAQAANGDLTQPPTMAPDRWLTMLDGFHTGTQLLADDRAERLNQEVQRRNAEEGVAMQARSRSAAARKVSLLLAQVERAAADHNFDRGILLNWCRAQLQQENDNGH